MLNTVINLHKSQGASSFSNIQALKRMLRTKKIGHLGTLDPMATGVLPVFTGKATKLIPLFNELGKEYRATLKLGQRTDTFDAEGTILQESSIAHLTSAEIEKCVARHQGEQQQLTPFYSAVKYNGIPAYRLARQGKEVERKAKTICIEHIRLLSIDLPFVVIEVKCSKGTYIRTLADDIGHDLQVGAHLVALERLSVGSHFSLENAHALEEISVLQQQGDFSWCINPVELLREWQTIQVNAEEQERLRHGQSLSIKSFQEVSSCENNPNPWSKAVDSQKTLIAIGHVVAHKNRYQFNPAKIFI